jgi:hypothetical protein
VCVRLSTVDRMHGLSRIRSSDKIIATDGMTN